MTKHLRDLIPEVWVGKCTECYEDSDNYVEEIIEETIISKLKRKIMCFLNEEEYIKYEIRRYCICKECYNK